MTLPERTGDAIWVDDLSVTYPSGTRALEATSLRLQAGAMTVLLGASGAGKSTLLRCLNGLVMPTAGRVVSRELGPLDRPTHWRLHRARTGMVFQQHHLIGRQTVLDNVLMGRLGHRPAWASPWPWSRVDKALALAAIERVGLIEQALRRADELSGGQQQRVGVARALVQQPRLLLADEPIASLDPATAARLLGLLREICTADGLTVVVSLHQVDFARQFGDRIVGLHRGAVVFDGPPAALDPDRMARLYGAAPAADGDCHASPERAESAAPRTEPLTTPLTGVPA
jgi:phosphonate transport system ATP-binding protein